MTATLSPRQSGILKLLRDRGSMQIMDLAEAFAVSTETIRRDIKTLVAARDLVKSHGAVALPHVLAEAPFERRMRENLAAKQAIARKAAQMVADGDSLMIDAGTTTSVFARQLLLKRNLTVVTNSSDIARTLATVNGNKVYMAGGELNGENGAAFGPSAIALAQSFHVRHAFVSMAGLHAEFGASDAYFDEAEFARTVLSRGEHRIILSDATKFGNKALVKVCDFAIINRLVCDRIPDAPLRSALAAAGVGVSVVAA